jgi:DNA-directed RNA polymerase specialized sigma subunit
MQVAMDQWVEKVVAGAIATVFGSITWLVRTVLTNNRKIEMLEKEIAARDERRNEDRKVTEEIKQDMKDLRKDLHEFMFSMKR